MDNNKMQSWNPAPVWNTVNITDGEYGALADFIYKESGIFLGKDKRELLKTRLTKRISALNLKTYQEYYDYLRNDSSKEELAQMLDAVTTNVTQFFREKQHFDFLTKTALPEIAAYKKKSGDKMIRIWSAAVASGEEIYTILITAGEFLKDFSILNCKALGTDISRRALHIAKEGLYDSEKMKDIPAHLQQKYFDNEVKDGKEFFRVKDVLKSRIVLRRFNLVKETFPLNTQFDIIFCRNVMIYFDLKTRDTLVNKLYERLRPGGYFFIGCAESLIGVQSSFTHVAQSVFKK